MRHPGRTRALTRRCKGTWRSHRRHSTGSRQSRRTRHDHRARVRLAQRPRQGWQHRREHRRREWASGGLRRPHRCTAGHDAGHGQESWRAIGLDPLPRARRGAAAARRAAADRLRTNVPLLQRNDHRRRRKPRGHCARRHHLLVARATGRGPLGYGDDDHAGDDGESAVLRCRPRRSIAAERTPAPAASHSRSHAGGGSDADAGRLQQRVATPISDDLRSPSRTVADVRALAARKAPSASPTH